MMKKTFIKDGRTFECVATEENVKHLALSGWVLQVANPAETATIEAQPNVTKSDDIAESAPAPRKPGRPRKVLNDDQIS